MMQSFINLFRSAFQNNLIIFQNEHIGKLINKFSFHLFNKDTYNTDLFTKAKLPIFFIDKYQENKSKYNFGGDYYVICYNYCLVLVDELTLISHFLPFFKKDKDSEVYCFSEQVKNEIIQLSKTIHLNFCDNSIIYNKNSQFSSKFIISETSNIDSSLFNKICLFWKIVRRSLSGFLLAKSLNNSKINRIEICEELFQSKIQKIQLKKEEYIQLGFIKQGNSASIELVYLIDEEQILAMKIFFENNQKVFQREIENYTNFHHPFCPQFYGTGKIDKYDYILIEFIQGKTLHEINTNNISYRDKIKFIFEIMIIIEHIHNNHYIYRDLTPHNIMIEQYSNILVLIDFDRMIKDDLIVSENEVTKDFNTIFKSPEILEGQRVTSKTDIYSIGMLVRYFFDEITIQENQAIKKIINKCTEVKPEKRPNISQLINYFYQNLFSNITKISEKDCIKSCKNIHDKGFAQFWVYLTECENPESQFQLGLLHEEGKLNGINNTRAIQYYKLSAAQNKTAAEEKLKHFNMLDEDVIKKIKKSLEESYRRYSCEHSQSYDQFIYNFRILGIKYDRNLSFEQNFERAIKYFSQQLQQNDKVFLNKLGFMYMEGDILPQDYEKALHYLTMSAEQKFAPAQCNIGLIYWRKNYIKKDIDKAIYYLKLASDQNLEEAQFYLGRIYFNEKKDFIKSIEYYTLAADNNHPTAQFILGKIYENGDYVERNMTKAIHYYKRAAEQNNIKALYILGNIYIIGQFVTKDINKAIDYLTFAADQQSLESQSLLGFIYLNEHYNVYNIDKSIHYLTMAANRNSKEVQYNLGYLYATKK